MFSYLKRMDWWGFIKSFGLPKPVMLKFFNNVTKLSTAQCFRYCGEKLIVSWGGPFPSTLKCYRYENAFILNVAVFLPELGHCHFPPTVYYIISSYLRRILSRHSCSICLVHWTRTCDLNLAHWLSHSKTLSMEQKTQVWRGSLQFK